MRSMLVLGGSVLRKRNHWNGEVIMVEIPEKFQGLSVVHAVRHVTDESEAPYAGTVWLSHGDGEYTVTSIFTHDGKQWDAQNGTHRVSVRRAGEVFAMKCEQADRFRTMVLENKVTPEAVSLLRWDTLPVDGREEFTVYARHVADLMLNRADSPLSGMEKVRKSIEEWMFQYDQKHGKTGQA